MTRIIIYILSGIAIFCFSATEGRASGMYAVHSQELDAFVCDIDLPGSDRDISKPQKPDIIERFLYGSEGKTDNARVRKLPAVLVTVFLGPFGGHRIYMGTHFRVPVIYTLTLGGGFGVLPLCDLIAILTADNLEKYEDDESVIMWMSTKK